MDGGGDQVTALGKPERDGPCLYECNKCGKQASPHCGRTITQLAKYAV